MRRSTVTAKALATTALAPVLAALLSGAASAATVLPTGGKVAAGQAVIGASSGSSLSITQSSSKAVIDWTGFSIGHGDSVSFLNGKGATLNRVTGGSVSALDGLLSGTGSVFLINPNGVLIGKNGVVQTGGSFVASTQDLSDAAFLKGGDLTFTGASNAAIVNEGKVGSLGGDVALIAASVTNTGSVAAANGAAGLVSGYSVLMRDASLDNGQFSVLLGGSGTSAANGGTITAANAELRAEGGNVYALAGDTAGTIRATGVKTGQGKVWLVADGGTLDVAGTIEAQGANGAAGAIETSGGTVTLGKASIDAHKGTWLVDPDDLEIDNAAATTIDAALNAGTNVTEQTNASGAPTGAGQIYPTPNPLGDILVDAAITWNTTASLTLSSYHSLYFEAPVTVAGAGSLTLITDNSGAGNGGTLMFDPTATTPGIVQFTAKNGAGQPAGSLFIGTGTGTPQAYILVSDLATLSNDLANDAANNDAFNYYALATKVDGSNGGAGYTQSPLISTVDTEPFDGVLEGLGNTINKLTINDTTNVYVGLFGGIDSGSTVRDLVLANVAVSASQGDAVIGALAAQNVGTIIGVTASSGTVTAGSSATIGGLVGQNDYDIDSSESDVTATAMNRGSTAGVLAGYSSGTISNSVGDGSVTAGDASDVGGLVGRDFVGGLIDDSAGSSVIGGVGAYVGGLVGDLEAGSVSASSAVGSVQGGDQSYVGGLIGFQQEGAATNNFSAGSVTGGIDAYAGGLVGYLAGAQNEGGEVQTSYSTAVVTGGGGSRDGGLVGYNTGFISNDYASGAVTGGGADSSGVNSSVGGLVGYNDAANSTAETGTGTITNAYALGPVSGANGAADIVGGLVGSNLGSVTSAYAAGSVSGGASSTMGGFTGVNSGTISAAYYDQTTTGEINGVGNQTDGAAGVAGFTDDQASTTSTYSAFNFGITPGGVSGGATWVIVDSDGSLNNANGATGGTRPFLLSEYSTTINNSHELQLMALDLSGAYTGGDSFSASDTRPSTNGAADMWSSAGFIPLGGNNSGADFTGSATGVFVSQLYINDTTNTDVGLFGVIGSPASLNEVIVNGSVSSSVGTNVGVVAGSNAAGLTTVAASGSVSASNVNADVGGVTGVNTGTITDGRSVTNVTLASGYQGGVSGGLVGDNEGAITGSVALGSVTGGQLAAGGLAGMNSSGGTITTSYATGVTTGGVLDDSNVDGTIVGGLVGYNLGSVSTSYATGAVGGGGEVGGLIGNNQGPVAASYASGAVTGGGSGYVGGLVAVTYSSTISNSYATGAVVAGSDDYAGGFAGLSGSTITTSYATGAVSAAAGATPQGLGGFVGTAPPAYRGTFVDTYWDSQTSGQTQGAGDGSGPVGITPLTTAQFMNPASFSGPGWTFGGLGSGANWVIVDADGSLNGSNGATRPFLTSEYSTTIVNAHQLQLMAMDLGGSYVFGDSVDASATADTNPSDMWSTIGFIPIGYAGTPFTGTLDGRGGGEVDNLTINTSANYVGLFGVTGPTAVVENMSLYEPSIIGAQIVGAFAGVNEGLISGVGVDGGSVTGTTFTGGIVGYNTGIVSNVVATEPVNGGDLTGGVVGSNDVGGVITGSGGFNTVTGTGAWVGGVAGYNNGVIVDSLANGTVGGNQLVGGLVGSANTQSSISVSYAESTVTGSDQIVGGLVGYNAGAIANTYAIGSVQGADRVGGLVGFNDYGASVATSYADASVKGGDGATQLGGFAGYDAGSITFGYFNADDAGSVPGVGASPNADADNAGAVTANGNTVGRDPTLQQNYMGFDPNIWTFYPDTDPNASAGEPTLTDSRFFEQ